MAQLYFRYSTMGAGKSIEVQKVAFNYEERGQNPLVFTSSLDNRFAEAGVVASRIGLIEETDPDKIEFELKKIVPEEEQFNFSMRIGEHGRLVCKAKNPDCENCFMNDICRSAFKV